MLLYLSLLRPQQEHTGHAAGLPVKRLDSGTGTQQNFTANSSQEVSSCLFLHLHTEYKGKRDFLSVSALFSEVNELRQSEKHVG